MPAPQTPRRLDDQFDIDVDMAARTMRVFGDLDMVTGPMLVTGAFSMLAWAPGDLTLDLAGVSFADSALLKAIYDIRGKMYDDGDALVVINASAAAKRLFLAAGSTEVLGHRGGQTGRRKRG